MGKINMTISIDIELYKRLIILKESKKLNTYSGKINDLLWRWVKENEN